MAYITTEQVSEMRKELKKVIPKSWKFSFTKQHHSVITLKILKADVNLLEEYHSRANHEWKNTSRVHLHADDVARGNNLHFDDKTNELFRRIGVIMDNGNFDNSDYMSDYHHVGWYAYISIDTYDGFEVS
jgi:hypothetical protein